MLNQVINGYRKKQCMKNKNIDSFLICFDFSRARTVETDVTYDDEFAKRKTR